MNIRDFQSRFPTDEACRAHMEALRWPQGPVCPRCGSVGEATRSTHDPRIWRCRPCRHEFRVTDGTAMEGTHLPLTTWFTAMYLIANSSCTKRTPKGVKGMSALKLKDWLGVSYKTAWFLGHRIRQMFTDGTATKLTGIVEADETYIGGRKPKGRDDDEDSSGRPSHDALRGPLRARGPARTAVLVAAERGGKVKGEKIESHAADHMALKLWKWCDVPNTILSTDELPAYRWIGREMKGNARVRHAIGEYAKTCGRTKIRAHVCPERARSANTAECFNGQLCTKWAPQGVKRAIIGVWRVISRKPWSWCVGEVAFRWNHRGADASARIDTMLFAGRRLRWRELTA